MERTEEQKKAINSTGNVIVSAGAGSGKTSILTERIFVNILNGVKLDEILILTFANDAANEMRVRLKKQLGNDERTKHLVPIVDAANICTFDAYFLFLVQKYSSRLGISSDVSVIPDDIISVKKNELLRSYFLEMAENPSKVDDIIFQNYTKKQPNALIKVINEIDRVFENETDYEALKLRLQNEFLSDEGINNFIDNLLTPNLKNEFYEIIKIVDGIKDEKYIACFYNIFNPLLKDFTLKNVVKFFNETTYKLSGSTKISDPNKKVVSEALSAYKKKLIGIDIDKVLSKDVEFNRLVIPRLIDIVARLNKDIKKYKFEKNAFTFSDIAIMAFNLLKDNDDIRLEIKNKLKLIMIDEYQDTSIFQEQFINMIENNNNFVVGDVKQSIYAFRGANPKQFMDKYRNYKANKGGMAIDMNINFRSREEVTEAINSMFSEVMTLDYGGADYKKEHIIEHGNVAYEEKGKTKNPHGIFSLEFRKYKNSAKNTESEILAIAKNIKTRISNKMQVFDRDLGKLRDCEYRDFAILIAKGSKFHKIEQIFNDEGIPINAVYDENIISDDGVTVLINILKMISYFNNPLNSEINEKHAFFSILRSFLFEYSDQELYNLSIDDKYKTCSEYKLIQEFAYQHKNSLIHNLYIDVLNDFDFLDKLTLLGNAIDKLKYNRIFYDRTKLMDNFGYTLDNFIEYLGSLNELGIAMESRTSSDVKNAVTLTTIHKSKGLEFGIVYFPFSRSGPKPDSTSLEGFFINKNYGVFLPSLYNDKNANLHSIFSNYFIAPRNQSELIRLLYVGLTRAEEEAIILNEREATFEEYLSDFTEEQILAIKEEHDLDSFDSAIKWIKMEYDSNFGPKETPIEESEEIEEEFISTEDELNEELSNIKAVGDLFDVTTYDFKPEYYHNFEPIEGDEFDKKVSLESIFIDPYRYEFKPLKAKVRASKVKSDIANAGALKFGTHLHLLLEGVDFKTKDTSFIKNEFEKKKIDDILQNHIFDDLENAIFYKEYEYFDEINNMIGIIDLLIEKEDELLVIDYKTKNIDDSDYDKQLNVYKNYVERKFNKKAKCYLLSIMDNEIREIK